MVNILFLHAGAEMYGADKVLLTLLHRLDKNKYKPYVILPCNGVLVSELKHLGIEVTIIPYPIMRRKYFNLKGIFKYGYNLIKYSRQLTDFAKQNKIDIIHTNTAATVEGCYVSKKLHIPQLWSIHEIIVSPMIMYKITSKLIANYASTTITDSNAVKEHLIKSGYFKNESVKVIYNGVNSDHFNPNINCEYLYEEWDIPQNSLVIGMMGRVNSWKGQLDFLKAANILMGKFPDLYVVFIGSAFEGEEWREKELEMAISDSPYSQRIINCGYRTDSKEIYKMFDIFVLPSTNPDPLPTVVLEAMATGKPIIGYRHGGVCEMVQEGYNGFLAEVRNPKDLAHKIEKLLKEDSLRNEMGLNSRKRLLENFSIEAYIENYMHEYDNLM